MAAACCDASKIFVTATMTVCDFLQTCAAKKWPLRGQLEIKVAVSVLVGTVLTAFASMYFRTRFFALI
jgi:hypothetical protein